MRCGSRSTFALTAALALLGATPAEEGVPAPVQKMIEAHGGLEAWRSAPTVSFTDEWSGGRATRVTVEQTSRRAYLEVPGTEARIAWDGEKAWSENWTMSAPPRFLVGLNYYFLNLPWLTMDPGVQLADEGRVSLGDDPTAYHAVRMTFASGVGDTPDDYYLLYIDPQTWRLHGCEYIVTYRAVLPEGVDATPPHDLLFEEFETVDGLVVPTRFTIYEKDGSVYAACSIRDWSFREPFDESRLVMPEGAVIDESLGR